MLLVLPPFLVRSAQPIALADSVPAAASPADDIAGVTKATTPKGYLLTWVRPTLTGVTNRRFASVTRCEPLSNAGSLTPPGATAFLVGRAAHPTVRSDSAGPIRWIEAD
jgi:hypothetical protein